MLDLPTKRSRAPQTVKEMLAHLSDMLEILGRKSGQVGMPDYEDALLDLARRGRHEYNNGYERC